MSGPYCKTCFYFQTQPLGDRAMGECSDPAYQRFYSIAGLWKQMKPEEFYYQQRYPLARPIHD